MHDSREMPLDPSAVTAAPPVPPVGPRAHPWLAWLAILAIGAALVYWQNVGRRTIGGGGQQDAAQLVLLEFQMRLYVAFPDFANAGGPADPAAQKNAQAKMNKAVESLNRGSIDQRLCVIVTLGEIDGPARAKSELTSLAALLVETNHQPTEHETKLIDILTRLYTDYDDGRLTAPTVTPEEREDLIRSLGWFGKLALNPKDPDALPNPERLEVLGEANQSLIGAIGIGVVALAFLAVGLGGLLILAILSMSGVWKSGLGTPVAHHGIYAETFALWFGLYFSLIFFAPESLRGILPSMVEMMLPMALSLVVLAWPVIRGLSWKQVRQDIGWTLGRSPLLEPIIGVISYANSLPFVIVGLGATLLLNRFVPRDAIVGTNPFQPDPSMAHPLIQQLRSATAADILPYFLLMSVMAPIMEETMFRGCLYRNLRDATYGWRFGMTFAAVAVSVLFAAVHPQGVFAIPLLASLACGFTLAREWRGTLISSIIAHGLNNSLILAFAIVCLMKW